MARIARHLALNLTRKSQAHWPVLRGVTASFQPPDSLSMKHLPLYVQLYVNHELRMVLAWTDSARQDGEKPPPGNPHCSLFSGYIKCYGDTVKWEHQAHCSLRSHQNAVLVHSSRFRQFGVCAASRHRSRHGHRCS